MGYPFRCLLAFLLLVSGTQLLRGQEPATARARLDHLILGIHSLERGIQAFAELSGVTPRRGGQHPGAGTENALLSLGEGAYLEVIAPQPGATPTTFGGLTTLERLTPVGWALRTDSLDVLVARLRNAGMAVLGPFPGSRRTPEGSLLSWRTAHPADSALLGAPFLIEWQPGTVHPSESAPQGCRLAELTVADPAPPKLNGFFHLMGVNLVAAPGASRTLRFRFQCGDRTLNFSP